MTPTLPPFRSDHAGDNGFVPRSGFEAFDVAAAEQSIVDRLRAVARQRGTATALVDGNVHLSYDELIGRASMVGQALAGHLGGRQGVVVLQVTTARAAVEGLLGVLFAGYPYLCLPTSAAGEVLRGIVRSASPAAILTDDSTAEPAAPPGVPRFRIDELRRNYTRIAVSPAAASDLACVFATSGTTGTPKLVGLSHRAVAFDIGRQTNDLFLGPDDRIDLLFHASFSASLSSVFSALLTGAQLHLGPPPGSVTSLGRWLRDSEITVSTMTVSTLRTLCASLSRADVPRGLRLVSVGGEALLDTDVRAFNDSFPPACVLQNAMASTETRTYAQYFVPRNKPLDGSVPIGWPVHGKDVAVVDSEGIPLPAGEEGEILVRSRFLADGYINDPELTSARFAPQPDGTAVFRTGDRARLRDDGCLVFVGRADSLVKIRGYRVELQAVERALLADDRVREAAVVRRTSSAREDYVAAFVVLKGTSGVTERDIRELLLRRVAAYEVPSAIHVVPRLPLGRNGKVDYRSLAEGVADDDPPASHLAPPDRLSILCGIWASALDLKKASPEDDFFANGGDSLSAIRLQLHLHQQLGVDLSLATLVGHPTPRAVAAWMDEPAMPPGHPALVLLHPGGTGPPLFCVPGIGGAPQAFSHLAGRIGDDRPVYGFRVTATAEPAGESLRIEVIARDYIAALDTVVDPTSRVHLCGHSFGGIVALEMAHQLCAGGRRLGLFSIIDTPLGAGRPGIVGRIRDMAANLPQWLWYDGLQSDWAVLRARAIGKLAEFWRSIRPFRTLGAHLEYPDLRAYFGRRHIPMEMQARVHARIDAARRYVRRPLSGTVVLFRSRAQALTGRSDRCLGWDALASGVEVYDVPGHHDSCTRPPHVQHLSSRLAERLREADA